MAMGTSRISSCCRGWGVEAIMKPPKNISMVEIYAVLGYYAALSGSSVPMFQGNISLPSSRVKESKKLLDP
jgi:hypothetical protein